MSKSLRKMAQAFVDRKLLTEADFQSAEGSPLVTVEREHLAKEMTKFAKMAIEGSVDGFEREGARGGSFVRLSQPENGKEDYCHIQVGHSCVVTVDADIPVTWLAAILTTAKDQGFRAPMGRPDEFPADYALQCNPEYDPDIEKDR